MVWYVKQRVVPLLLRNLIEAGCASLVKMKIFDVLFCIVFNLHYLCTRFQNCVIYNKV